MEIEVETEKKQEWFLLDNEMYNVSEILYLKLDGGPDGFGCWGMIKLKGMSEAVTIGDGSYENCSRHVKHMVAGEYGFKTLRKIMKEQAITD